MCSKRMASARDRGPKVTTTVISTTEAAGCDVTIRRILGRWSEASTWVRSPIWAPTRSVVQPTVCLSGREPASISTITWANCLGNAVACPQAATARPGTALAAVPAGAAVARSAGWSGEAWRLAADVRLGRAAARATGHAAPWVSQSYGGQPAGTVMSRSLGSESGVSAGAVLGRGRLGGAGRRGRRAWGAARRVGREGRSTACYVFQVRRMRTAANALGGRVRIRLRLDSFVPQATDISASCLVTELSRARRATFPR